MKVYFANNLFLLNFKWNPTAMGFSSIVTTTDQKGMQRFAFNKKRGNTKKFLIPVCLLEKVVY